MSLRLGRCATPDSRVAWLSYARSAKYPTIVPALQERARARRVRAAGREPPARRHCARAPENISLRPADWYEQQRIELRLGSCVVGIDSAAHRLTLQGGETLAYFAPDPRSRRARAVCPW